MIHGATSAGSLPGAFVISLDFELHWGVRAHTAADGPYRVALLNARVAVERMLELFEAYGVAATWATVGLLFCRTRAEQVAARPAEIPEYADPRLDPYREAVGENEAADPLHFAASLVERIRRTPRQEIGTHTFGHYFCGEPGATPETFRADLTAARRVAAQRRIELRSIVFPRNQAGEAFIRVLPQVGIDVYRGNPPGRLWQVEDGAEGRRMSRRLARLVDTYLPTTEDDTVGWDGVLEPSGLANVRASRLLRPYSPALARLEPLRHRRIARGMARAARKGRIYHLWWHPHNFGMHLEESLGVLRRVLDVYAELRERYGFESLTMAEVADQARASAANRSDLASLAC